eukprot:CAMPEP_0206536104 /NCGR_PEP_ID=MMETSP0325_2-20121206/6547_1 /ASSEMBLY_ACC=CAM_ASM_000347 /TAXON_ID=2866 /ORGANISM="Crypthecodinium cohnii, Strain Seligo" /LENGTH=149 /DNA_ID=CAMNT_0054033245 /DNA_START=432 /DNA_END=877 /DNA_ORIENTATION=-
MIESSVASSMAAEAVRGLIACEVFDGPRATEGILVTTHIEAKVVVLLVLGLRMRTAAGGTPAAVVAAVSSALGLVAAALPSDRDFLFSESRSTAGCLFAVTAQCVQSGQAPFIASQATEVEVLLWHIFKAFLVILGLRRGRPPRWLLLL